MRQSSNAIQEVYVSFQNAQVVVRTNMSAVVDFVRDSHAPMIVAAAPNVLQTIHVMKLSGGYRLGDQTIAAEGEPSILFDLLRQTIQREFVAADTDTLWLHAGAVADDSCAIVIAGPSTAGKSTLVTQLIGDGFLYMTDELLGLSSDLTATGYPRIPIRRKKASRELTRVQMGNLERETINVPIKRIRRSSAPLRAIIFAQYEHGAETELARLSSGDAAMRLLQTLFNFAAQQSSALTIITQLARTVHAYKLKFGDTKSATQSIISAIHD